MELLKGGGSRRRGDAREDDVGGRDQSRKRLLVACVEFDSFDVLVARG